MSFNNNVSIRVPDSELERAEKIINSKIEYLEKLNINKFTHLTEQDFVFYQYISLNPDYFIAGESGLIVNYSIPNRPIATSLFHFPRLDFEKQSDADYLIDHLIPLLFCHPYIDKFSFFKITHRDGDDIKIISDPRFTPASELL